MKANITLKMDAELLRELRVLAAKDGRSVSAFVGSHLEEFVSERKHYERARRRELARLRKGMDFQWTPPRSRAELHER